MSKSIQISFIILNYNTPQLVLQCIKSLMPHLQLNWEILIVDNNSHDSSLEMFKQLKDVRVIASDKNLGFAGGNNLGMKAAKGKYVFLLNSDTIIPDSANLSLLLDHFADPKVAAVSPFLQLADGTLDWSSHRGIPSVWNSFCYFTGLAKLSVLGPAFGKLFGGYHQRWNSLSKVHQVDAVSCAAILVSQSAIHDVGYLDDDFFMYGEDLDWCYRMKKKNWKILFDPRVRVVHLKGMSGTRKQVVSKHDKQIKMRTKQYFFDTMIQFYDKHYKQKYPAFIRTIVVAGIRAVQYLKGVFHA